MEVIEDTRELDAEQASNDLGHLAWVLDELKKSLDGATKAMRRFVRDAELARGSDLANLDASHLRIARQQLHQAVGAMEMVGFGAPAKVMRAMESLAQKFVARPEQCSDDAANRMESASFALTEYLEGVLKGKGVSSVGLFHQYRQVMELLDGERIHPADLWTHDWRWADFPLPGNIQPLGYNAGVRAQLDQNVLKTVKGTDPVAAMKLRDLALGLAAAQAALPDRSFWQICAAFFEASAKGLLPADIYSKRAGSRVLQQYATLAKNEGPVSDSLARDLLFFCAHAKGIRGDAPVLTAVRQVFKVSKTLPVNYDAPHYGKFDPALLVAMRKRIATAAESWSALAGGDTNRLKPVSDQFGAVAESMLKMHPEYDSLARALARAVDAAVRTGEPPSTPVAMEVATTVLYLEAAYDDLDPSTTQMVERGKRLADRLDKVSAGGQSEPLEDWMEELYRRVSDRQTMGSVVDELRTNLGEIEKSLDQFFRNPSDKSVLGSVPGQLSQMRGVFSVLGLDQASTAMLRMRDSVEKMLVDNVTAGSPLFEKLGNSLGAVGFLIDMLGFQRAMAKKVFVWDDAQGEFKPLMGRQVVAKPAAFVGEPQVPQPPAVSVAPPFTAAAASLPPGLPSLDLSPVPEAVQSSLPSKSPKPPLSEDDLEIREIFLEEAAEVVQNGKAAIEALRTDPANLADQTTLRRAFHTLKGSSRMIGLTDFGEAAWAMEQMMNAWLAEQKPASTDLLSLTSRAMGGFGVWVARIAEGADELWHPKDFRIAADAMRLQNTLVLLSLPEEPVGAESTAPIGNQLEQVPAQEASTSHLPEIATELHPPSAIPSQSPSVAEPFAPETAMLEEPGFEASQRPSEFQPTSFFDASNLSLAADAPAAEPQALGLDELDFAAVGQNAPAEEMSAPPEDFVATSLTGLDTLDSGPEAEEDDFAPTGVSVLPESQPAALAEESVKVIGNLRIGIPLYNVFLNEADEWSRRLQNELGEWALELHKPVPESAIAFAHSLAGSSATVGFQDLSGISRALEMAMQHIHLRGSGTTEWAGAFTAGAEDIRRLLHQFAAGFLKEPEPSVMADLQAILETEFSASVQLPEVLDDLDFQPVAAPPEGSELAGIELSLAAEPPAPFQVSPVMVTVAAAALLPAAALQVAAPSKEVEVANDDIDQVDSLDADLFPIFDEEAQELLPQLGSALRQWSARPDNSSARGETLRVLHTLKGSARLAGALRLGEMAHRMESSIEQLGAEDLTPGQIEPLLTRFDDVQAAFQRLRDGGDQAFSLPEGDLTPVVGPEAAANSEATPTAVSASVAAFSPLPWKHTAPTPSRQASSQTLRVRAQLLDRLVNQSGEVMITRSRLESRLDQLRAAMSELSANLERMRRQLRDIEIQAESQMQSRMAQAMESAQQFDPLEFDQFTRLQELTRQMAESVNDVATVQRGMQQAVEGTEDDLIAQGRQARELQRDLLRTRMVEFESISERLYGVVRQASKDAGKQVKLDIAGGSLDVDRSVLERMAPAFEHLLRNSVAHGIEEPTVRAQRGKPEIGTITITLLHQSNELAVTFGDDGAGLDLQRIRDKAVSSGVAPNAHQMPDAEVANLIFLPGFSTAATVSEIAGRGIGMDVVRSEMNAIGGRIETSSEAGKGTQFRLVLPLTTAITQVVMLRMGELSVGVPANVVEIVRRVPKADVDRAYDNGSFSHSGETIPFFWGGALLQASPYSSETSVKNLPVAIFRSAGQRVAIHVDEVLGNQEVVVKNLGPQLSRLPGLTGMSVLASGAAVLIYNPVALVSVYGSQARALAAAAAQAPAADLTTGTAPPAASGTPEPLMAAAQVPLVLVVDDSITVRRVTQRLLKREGYRVSLAADGLQALERLAEERPAVVLSDIEMPRMDGFDLARNIRGHAEYKDLPIIMITSRIAEKHREHARELGVDHYLGKPYAEEELLRLVQQYCSEIA
jgi:chemosensory pili system protein ChpA (sensor histidine kinase/response regulator)